MSVSSNPSIILLLSLYCFRTSKAISLQHKQFQNGRWISYRKLLTVAINSVLKTLVLDLFVKSVTPNFTVLSMFACHGKQIIFLLLHANSLKGQPQ